MKQFQRCVFLVSVFLLGSSGAGCTSSHAQPLAVPSGVPLTPAKHYALCKQEQMNLIAQKRDLIVPPEFDSFFKAAISGEWSEATNIYSMLVPKSYYQLSKKGVEDPQIATELWEPLHETYWASLLVQDWSLSLASSYVQDLLDGIPSNSVLLATSDSARFLVSMLQPDPTSPHPFVVSCNALARSPSLDFMEDTKPTGFILPDSRRLNSLYGDVVARARRADLPAMALDPATQVSVVNAVLLESVVSSNKLRFEFFVDGSDGLMEWMYSYLEPHGLVLRCHRERIDHLDATAISMDAAYWTRRTADLLASPSFKENHIARSGYAKLRTAIARVYLYRGLYAEAEQALAQSLSLDPLSMDAVLCLARVYLEGGRFDEVDSLASSFTSRFAEVPQHEEAFESLDSCRKLFLRKRELESFITAGEIDLKAALELTDIYRVLGKTADFERMIRKILSRPIPPNGFVSLAQICSLAGRGDVMLSAAQDCVKQEGTNKWAMSNLAAAYLVRQEQDAAIDTLTRAVETNGDEMRELLRHDKRFDMLRSDKAFENLVGTSADSGPNPND